MEQIMKNTTMVEAERKYLVDYLSSPSSSSMSSSGSFSGSSSTLESDFSEEVTSPDPPLLDMSSLFLQLPIKRGLSKHYDGKSQSFTSLANVRSLEDLAKPENPYNKKMRCCRRGYGGGLMAETESCDSLSRQMSERSMRGSCSSVSVKRERGNVGITKRPPMAPHRSTSTTTIHTQAPLLA